MSAPGVAWIARGCATTDTGSGRESGRMEVMLLPVGVRTRRGREALFCRPGGAVAWLSRLGLTQPVAHAEATSRGRTVGAWTRALEWFRRGVPRPAPRLSGPPELQAPRR